MSFQGKTASPEHRAKTSASLMGRLKSDSAPATYPTLYDICWAAGMYEGDGWCAHNGTTEKASVGQVEAGAWVLERFRNLFGGTVRPVKNERAKNYFHWSISGARARGLLQTIYVLLSPRRQEQIRSTLRIGEFA